MRTVNTAHFQSTRPLRLQSRQSAAYKRIMALLYKGKGLDLMRGVSIDIVNSMETAPDIQLPAKATAKKTGYERHKWSSVINKMPLLPESDREIGGLTPSVCSAEYVKKVVIEQGELRHRIESH